MLPNHRFLIPLGALLLLSGCAGDPGARDLAVGDAALAGAVRAIAQPTVGYRADQVIVVDGERFDGRVYAMPGRQRTEMATAAEDIVSVVRYDEDDAVTWIEGTGILSRTPVGHLGIDLRSPNFIAFELEPLGPDAVDGAAAERYGYRADVVGGGTQEGAFWLTPENVIVRLEGTLTHPHLSGPRRVEVRLENLELGPQAPALFEPPGAPVDVAPDLFEEFIRPGGGLFVPPTGS